MIGELKPFKKTKEPKLSASRRKEWISEYAYTADEGRARNVLEGTLRLPEHRPRTRRCKTRYCGLRSSSNNNTCK